MPVLLGVDAPGPNFGGLPPPTRSRKAISFFSLLLYVLIRLSLGEPRMPTLGPSGSASKAINSEALPAHNNSTFIGQVCVVGRLLRAAPTACHNGVCQCSQPSTGFG